MKISKREFYLISTIGVLLLVVSVSFILHFDNNEEVEELNWSFENEEVEQVTEVQEQKILVDLKGEVASPGVYELIEGQRLIDLIELAGGLTEEADEQKINLASVLDDAMVIYIPKVGEEDIPMVESAISANSTTSNNGKIRINQATVEELQQLPGIGPAKADAIITYREENGPFQTIEDVQKVSGIGPKSVEKLQEYIEIR
ncbi:helix-hairpin-helix domain-containing protein [Alkalihalobacterium alkalinitrilicum]|uniref:helix-hairpin-helix domain-containing protein n=1 Tax=Alkalihalobacterium alkalinitrilicum TaxID=427920 RepID=UPI0009949F38|nr:helix-hairpin-helix domain-containing protein [Alkalihalobacterium alkalinitrilicum]